MKCFNHVEQDAIGSCKHCLKGLCKDCLTEENYGLSCKDKHEKDVEFLDSLIENNKKFYSSSKKTNFISNISTLLMGALFIYFGYEKEANFLIIMGFLFVGQWAYTTIYNFSFFKKINTNYEKEE